MTLEQLWNFIDFIINKEQSGHISPDQRNLLFSVASKKRFEDELLQYQRTQTITDSLRTFFVLSTAASIDSNGQYSLPANYRSKPSFDYIQTIGSTQYHRDIDLLTQQEYTTRRGSSIQPPSAKHPVFILTGTIVQFQPLRSTTALFSYIRNPLTPYYDYYIDEFGREVYKVAGAVKTDTIKGDYYSQLSTLVLIGVTDSNSNGGVLYWNFAWDTTISKYKLSIYKDETKLELVASASYATSQTGVTVSQENFSGITGTVNFTVKSKYGTLAGDTANQLTNIVLTGATLNNTSNFDVYWKLYLYSGSYIFACYNAYYSGNIFDTPASLMCRGSRASANGSIVMTAQNSSGLTGSVTIAYTTNDVDSGNTISAYPGDTDDSNFIIDIPASQTVELEWAYEDQLKIVGYMLEMAGVPLEQADVFKYAAEFKKLEI
jgi:hypothetical protein